MSNSSEPMSHEEAIDEVQRLRDVLDEVLRQFDHAISTVSDYERNIRYIICIRDENNLPYLHDWFDKR